MLLALELHGVDDFGVPSSGRYRVGGFDEREHCLTGGVERLNQPLQASDNVAVLGGVDAAAVTLPDFNQLVEGAAYDGCGYQPLVALDAATLFQVDGSSRSAIPGLSGFGVVVEGFGVERLAEGFNSSGNEVFGLHCGS